MKMIMEVITKKRLRKKVARVQRRRYKKSIYRASLEYGKRKSAYYKGDIARSQLETAVKIFLNGRDRFSVITLAGAASNILSQLVTNDGGEPFLDYARLIYKDYSGITPPREKYNKHLNQTIGINQLKHHSIGDPEHIELDEEKGAEQAITKAVADYISLYGQDELFVKAFLKWAWVNNDGEAIMENYKKIPSKLKR
jgi:hypothetical protein